MKSAELDSLTKQIVSVDLKLKELAQKREALRDQFFEIAKHQIVEDLGLMKKVVIVPKTFLLATKMTVDELMMSRFPGWICQDREEGEKEIKLLLEEDPDFKPWSYTHSTTRHVISKQIASPPVELDENTLRVDQPELWGRVMKPVTVYEPDTAAIQQAILEDPKLSTVFQLHTKYLRFPTKKLGPIRIEKEEE